MNDFSSFDAKKIAAAVETVKKAVGKEEAEKLERSFSAGGKGIPELSEKEMILLKTFIENPDLLGKLLSSEKGRDGLRKITDNLK